MSTTTGEHARSGRMTDEIQRQRSKMRWKGAREEKRPRQFYSVSDIIWTDCNSQSSSRTYQNLVQTYSTVYMVYCKQFDQHNQVQFYVLCTLPAGREYVLHARLCELNTVYTMQRENVYGGTRRRLLARNDAGRWDGAMSEMIADAWLTMFGSKLANVRGT